MAILFDRQYDLVYMKNRVLPNSFERKGCLWTSRSSRFFEILSKLLSSHWFCTLRVKCYIWTPTP